MNTTSLQIARQFLAEEAAAGVISIPPESLATFLHVSTEEALGYLFYLQNREKSVTVRAHVKCGRCGRTIKLAGMSLDAILSDARKQPVCRDCHDRYHFFNAAEIYLSFFLSPLSGSGQKRAMS